MTRTHSRRLARTLAGVALAALLWALAGCGGHRTTTLGMEGEPLEMPPDLPGWESVPPAPVDTPCDRFACG